MFLKAWGAGAESLTVGIVGTVGRWWTLSHTAGGAGAVWLAVVKPW